MLSDRVTYNSVMISKFFQWIFGGIFGSPANTDIRTLSYQSRLAMEKAIRTALQKKNPQRANQVAEHIANFIFNFGDYGFQLDTPQEVIKLVTAELEKSAELHSVMPDVLCRVLVHRGLEMKLNDWSFESHMRDLWSMGYCVIGPYTPPFDLFPTQPLRNLANRVHQMEVTTRQREQFEFIWKKHPSFKLENLSTKPDKNAKSDK